MDPRTHWESVYLDKAPNAFSWYRPHLDLSFELIRQAAMSHLAAIIDVGAGESTLVDDLLAARYENVTLLDISPTALQVTKERLGQRAAPVRFLTADVLEAAFAPASYDVWHDRAVFHFLTSDGERAAYVRQALAATKPGGHVIVGTFGPQGPQKCSGLDVLRYDAASLHDQFGPRFRLVESREELHETPSGVIQQFLYCYCVRE